MTMIRIFMACMMMTILPMAVGSLFLSLKEGGAKWLFAWIYGQICLWAGFLFTCIPAVVLKKKLPEEEGAYLVFCLVLLLLAGGKWILGRRDARKEEKGCQTVRESLDGAEASRDRKLCVTLWCVFAAFVILQVFCVFFLRYEDGDDSYYVAITTYAKEVGMLYRNIPYTGKYTDLDLRHALAPFPAWVAVLADVAGLSGAVTAHVVMPIFILAITYGLYYLLGEYLLGEKDGKCWKRPLFMSMVALLITFGGYSIYSAENFLIVRAGQGKAVLANVVIPALLFAVALLMRRLERKEKLPVLLWILIFLTMTTGCLCSTLGSFLLCVFFGVVILCGLICYRRWTLLPGAIFSMLVPVIMAACYVFLA